ncbi:ParB/RepB/Spo0J family partition protein [Sphingobium chungbukense]|uniref:ParB/RepB/Spo0J family partition protein n=1 Tax=Sphingobium chungbukense TaxID=56193 RepID=UPI0009FDB69E|nr:ParB/RepB/Spo0J family partition protein [Sphingobium chungbukense]
MKLDFLNIDKLVVAKANMRSRQEPDVSDILPSIRARGVLQSILVRPLDDGERYEVIAGNRRRRSAFLVAEERREAGDSEPVMVPAAIMEPGDDAAAVEASLIENLARLDPDEVSQWEAFVRLVKEGRTPDDIGATFGLPELRVKRILALGNLLPRIRTLYRKEEIDAPTIRQLTLATKSQQRDWLALWNDPDAHAPIRSNLKDWLFGGVSVPVKYALFDTEQAGGPVVADLFGEGGYFADRDQFWIAQIAAIARKDEAYREEGWGEVVIMETGDHFRSWEHQKAPKRKGGRVYVEVRTNGEVIFHEGYVTEKEARRIEKGEKVAAGIKIARPELSSALASYVDLHRLHAARAALLASPGLALRLLVAHAITGSVNWQLRPEEPVIQKEATKDSIERSPGGFFFREQQRDILQAMGFDADDPSLTHNSADIGPLLTRLMAMPDEAVMGLVALIMGETLRTGSVAVELIGLSLGIDMATWWEADDAFFELLRDKQLLVAMVEEVAGPTVAQANATEKTKTLKEIIQNYLLGTDGRKRCERWVPRWMRFPPSAYTDRGGVAMVRAHAEATKEPEVEEGQETDLPELEIDIGEEGDAPATDGGEEEQRLAA